VRNENAGGGASPVAGACAAAGACMSARSLTARSP
jgi:hypothetical protein